MVECGCGVCGGCGRKVLVGDKFGEVGFEVGREDWEEVLLLLVVVVVVVSVVGCRERGEGGLMSWFVGGGRDIGGLMVVDCLGVRMMSLYGPTNKYGKIFFRETRTDGRRKVSRRQLLDMLVKFQPIEILW